MISQFNRDDIIKSLRENVLDVSFTKADGTQRLLRCTLRPSMIPAFPAKDDITEETSFHKKKENLEVIAAWDVQKKAWRSFRLDSILYVQDVSESY